MLSFADYQELVVFRAGPHEIAERTGRLQRLIGCKFLEPCDFEMVQGSLGDETLVVRTYKLTLSGEDALDEYEQYIQHEADAKADAKRNRKNTIVAAIVGGISGAFFGGIMSIILRHFSSSPG